MRDETKKMTLYFPDIENGSASVGAVTVIVVDHRAEVDASEIKAIEHWKTVDDAHVVSEETEAEARPEPGPGPTRARRASRRDEASSFIPRPSSLEEEG